MTFVKKFIYALLGLPVVAFAAASYESACSDLQHITTAVSVTALPVEVDVMLNRTSIRQLTQHSNGVTHKREGLTFGTTEAVLEIEREANVASVTGPSGLFCYKVKAVSIELAYRPLKISIGSEIADDSCAYKAVIAHEQKHVEIYRANLPKVAAKLQVLLTDALSKRESVQAQDVGNASHIIDTELEATLPELVKIASVEVQAEHEQFDTKDVELFNISSCGGEVRNIVRQVRAR